MQLREMMDRHVLMSTVLLCTAVSVSASSEINKTTSNYSCCGTPTIEFDPKCDYSWVVNKQTIAQYNGGTQESDCCSPCKALEDGLLTLDQCVEVNADCVCEDGEFVVGEVIRYRGEPCSNAATGNLCSGVLLLLGVVFVVGWTSCCGTIDSGSSSWYCEGNLCSFAQRFSHWI